MAKYIALFDQAGGMFGASFPDCLGCTAMGKTFDEAHENAVEALHEWAADRVAGGYSLPKVRRYEDLRADPAFAEDFGPETIAVLIPAYPNEQRPVRVNVSMEASLVEKIDDTAKKLGLTRSGFLALAAKEKISATP